MSTDSRPSSSHAGSKPSGMWQPPSLEEMQAMLPQYQFESLLGRGGMGAVYKAVQISLDRPVAIKVLPGDLIDDTDAQFAERFKNEARTMAKMNHPAIVNVYDFGETQTGLLFIVMEFIDGTDVAKMIASQGKLPPDYALAITAHVCDALNYAHSHSIVHRDIKPANILINMEGAVKVADFGLAKQSDPGVSGLTKTNMAMGTPDFVAPEALIPGIPLDGRADLYAIGVMLYQMLTGEIPRGMWTMPSAKLGTDPRFDAIIGKAMQTDRETRYQTAASIRRDLDVIMTVPLVKAENASSSAAPQTQKPLGRQPQNTQERSEPAPKPDSKQPASNSKPKSKTGLYVGIAATVAVLGVSAFLFFGKKTDAGDKQASAATDSRPSPPIKKTEAVKPVIKTPAPQPAKTTTVTKTGSAMPPATAVTSEPAKAASDGSWVAWKGPKGEDASLNWQFSGPEARTSKRTTLWSPQSYDGDIEVELEWFVGARGNGGLFYHVGGTNELEAPEMQLADKANAGSTWSGGLFGIQGSTKELTKLNDWNTAKLVITGSKREHWINGERVCSYDVDSPGFANALAKAKLPVKPDFKRRSGRLVLQANAGEVAYRNLKVRQLEVPTPAVPVASTTMPAPALPATSPAPAPANDPVSLKLADLESKFHAALERDVGAAYKAQIANLNKGYTAALDRELASATKAGKLSDAVALREEKQRIAGGTNPPPEDPDDLPEPLKKLRDTWRTTEAGYAKARTTAAGPLFDAYDKALDAFQIELTRQNKIDEALRVKAVRDYVSTHRDSGAAAPSPPSSSVSPAPGTNTPVSSATTTAVPRTPTAPPLSADKVLPILPPATQEEVRALCEWCLNVKTGRLDIMDGTQRRTITSSKDLPKGKLTLLTIYIGTMPMDGEGKKWLAVVGRLPELESFYISGPVAGSMPIELLRGLTKIKSLRIPASIVDDAAFAHLTGLKSLESLIVNANCKQFTGTGLGYLNENLLELETDSQTISAEGLAYLPRFKKLRMLDLSRSNVTDDMLRALAVMPDLEELNVTNTKLDGSFLAYLPAKSKLKRISFTGVQTVKPENLVHLGKLKQLEVLNLPSIDPGREALTVIAGMDKLFELSLINNHVFTGEGFKDLKGFKGLKRLNLHTCPANDASLEAVAAAMPGLTSFEFTNSENNKATITVDGLARAFSRLKSLQSLQLNGERTTDQWMPTIAQFKGVDYLMLGGAQITDQGLVPVMKLPLGYLRLDNCSQITDAAIPILKTCPTLGNVPVSGTQMTDAGKAELQRVLDAHKGK